MFYHQVAFVLLNFIFNSKNLSKIADPRITRCLASHFDYSKLLNLRQFRLIRILIFFQAALDLEFA